MNDCTNAEMRDQLPDLLHERLDARSAAAVQAHVNDCVDCRDELQLLRDVRGAFERATPRVDVAYVVGALPLPPQRGVAAPARKRPLWADWRVAAAVTLIVAGGSSVAVLGSHGGSSNPPPVSSESVAVVARPTPAAVPTTQAVAPIASETVASSEPTGVPDAKATDLRAGSPAAMSDASGDSRFSGLSEQQLKALLGDIEKLQPVPVVEPEPVMIRVSGTNSEGV